MKSFIIGTLGGAFGLFVAFVVGFLINIAFPATGMVYIGFGIDRRNLPGTIIGIFAWIGFVYLGNKCFPDKKKLTTSQAGQVLFELLENADPTILTKDLEGYDVERIHDEFYYLNIFTLLNVIGAQETGTWREKKQEILKSFSNLILPSPPITDAVYFQECSEKLQMKEFSYFTTLAKIPGLYETVPLLSGEVSRYIGLHFAAFCGVPNDPDLLMIGGGGFLSIGRSLQQIIQSTRVS